MQIIKQSELDIGNLSGELKQGKVIVYPTETCYGLGGDAFNQSVVDKIFKIKKRSPAKNFLIIMSGIPMALQYIVWSPILQKIADKYWPGPLTVVAKVKDGVVFPKGIISEKGEIVFRITSSDFAADLCRKFKGPIISTSANISGSDNPYDIEAIIKNFGQESDQPDIVVDTGKLPTRPPSTIINVNDGKIKVLRQGEIRVDM